MTALAPSPAPRSGRGPFARARWLLARRAVQVLILACFLAGPLAGIWLIKGNLASSLFLNTVPLSDPFVLAQTIAAGHLPEATALIGAAITVVFYALVGGRVFCSWVCPVGVVTDAAAWLRRRFRLPAGRSPSRHTRHAVLAAVLIACALSGSAVWEAVNPVSLTQRALIFGGSLAWTAVAAVFVYDLLVAPHGWCGHLCPHGAAWSLIGAKPIARISAQASSRCDDCGDCFAVCPEPQVIPAALKARHGAGPVIDDAACTNCARCIDVCDREVFRFTHRWDSRRT